MKKIDPCPVLRDDGGADFKDDACPGVCYTVNKEGMSTCTCEFLEIVPSWAIPEFCCSAPESC